MKSFFLSSAIVCGALFAATMPAHSQGIYIERLQRAFQARYHLVNGGYVEWPKYKESSETPAPHFPKDGYYGDLLSDPDMAVRLVKDLAKKFDVDYVIFTQFVKAENGFSSLEGASSIANYLSNDTDMQPGSITHNTVAADNWLLKLNTLKQQIAKLKLVKVDSSKVSILIAADNADSKLTENIYWYVDDPFNSSPKTCSDFQSCVISAHPGTDWGSVRRTQNDCSIDGTWSKTFADILTTESTTRGADIVTYSKIQCVFESLSEPDLSANVYSYPSAARTTRGKIQSDLTGFPRGTAKAFLKLGSPSCTDSYIQRYGARGWNPDPSCSSVFSSQGAPIATSVSVDNYSAWTGGDLVVGDVATTGYIVPSSLPAAGGCADNVATLSGWAVDAVVVVVAPDFSPDSDPQDPCNCATCEPGSLALGLHSIHMNVDFGSDNYGGAAGNLSLHADFPTPVLSSIAALHYVMASSVVKISSGTPIDHLQFKTSQALIDVKVDPSNAYKYRIKTYKAAYIGSIGMDGFYQTTGSESRTITVENPDASPTVYNKLWITETVGSNNKVSKFEFNSTTRQWDLKSGNDIRRESRVSANDSATTRSETYTVKDNSDVVIYKEKNTYTKFAWGEELTSRVIDPDSGGLQLTTSWNFYSSTSDGDNYKHLKSVIDQYGHWVKYSYDSSGREIKRVIQFNNTAITSNDNENRVITTTYGTSDPQISVVETLKDHDIGKSFRVIHSGEVRDIIGQQADADWNDTDSLVTTTKRYTTGDFIGELKSVEHPDGTAQLYTYNIASSQRIETVDSGHLNGTAIDEGTRTITTKGSVGELVSRYVYNITGGTVGTLLASETYSSYDDFHRPQQVQYLDGTTVQTLYGCCGVSQTTDRDGLVTEYLYDDLKRQYGFIAHYASGNITYANTLDPLGQVKARTRTGSSSITLGQATYDKAGRILTEVNGLGSSGTTTYSESVVSGQRVRTATYPDSGTRVETYNQDGTLAKVTGTAAFGVQYTYDVEEDGTGGPWRAFVKETKLDASGTPTSEWTKSYSDPAGRIYKVQFADSTTTLDDNPYSQSFYNDIGQRNKQRDPDGIVTLYHYNNKGELEYATSDLDGDGVKDTSGPDRVRHIVSDVVSSHSTNVRRTRSSVFPTDSSSTELVVAMTETAVDGLKNWSTVYKDGSTPVETQTQTIYNNNDGSTASGYRTTTVTHPDSSKIVSVFYQGRLVSVANKSSTGSQISKTFFTYDSHGRQWKVADARNGTNVFTYNNADLVVTATSPAPGNGAVAQTTTTLYDNSLRAYQVLQPDGTTVNNEFYQNGLLKKTSGSRTYPVEYTYDYAGRMATMKTWQNFAGNSGTATTTWNYNQYRGWLDNKRYPDSTGPDYEYTLGGRLKKRKWARTGTSSQRIETIYTYGVPGDSIGDNDHGDLVSVTYANDPQGTSGTSYTYDRRGRQKTINCGSTTTTLSYNDADELTSESNSGGTLGGLTITSGYDSYLRPNSLSVNTSPSTISYSYGYDTASRLSTVTDGTDTTSYSATYAYVANSPLVGGVTFKQGTTVRMATTNQFDYLNRLQSVSSAPSASGVAPISFAYAYNNANQRTRVNLGDGSFWLYEYDTLGQVRTGKKYWSDWTPVAGQQFEYTHDDIGNRTQTLAGGDETGDNLRSSTYSHNNLNQYTSRTVPGAVDVMGVALANVSVTVSDGTTSYTPYRKGEYFRKQFSVANSSAALWQGVSVSAPSETTVNRDVFVSKTPENYDDPSTTTVNEGFDADGNQLRDGRWAYTWDAENRLVRIVASIGSGPQRIDFEYDCKGRRISKKVFANTAGTGTPTLFRKFVYDGWNLIAELDGNSSDALKCRYLWGNDLSGTSQGAGGVGGLLALVDGTAGAQFCAYDGNGNVAAVTKATDGSVSALYEYGPFGEPLRATGSAAFINPFRFSTKYSDDEGELQYYGYRYYSSTVGRFANRDIAEEMGGPNLFGFAGNDPIDGVDLLGLAGYFFDGTNNDGDRDRPDNPDAPNGPTNVKILFDLYGVNGEKAWYLNGVGTRESGKFKTLLGLAFGNGGQARVEDMLGHLRDQVAKGDCDVDVFGFSRGAAQAREFVYRVSREYPDLKIRFLGIFDTVLSTPNPQDYHLKIPDTVQTVIHPIAAHERRSFFPLSSIRSGPTAHITQPDWWEFELAGVHTDVGGGYKERRQFANLALRTVHQQAVIRGVPLGPIPKVYLDTNTENLKVHDSRWPNDKIRDLKDWFYDRPQRPREIIYYP